MENINTHDWDVSAGGGSSNGAVSSSSELDLQLLPTEIHSALNIQRELGVLSSHHVQKTILLDIDSSSDCSRRCSGGVGQKLSIDLQEVSKIDETLRHHIVTLVGGVGWLVG